MRAHCAGRVVSVLTEATELIFERTFLCLRVDP